MGSDPVILVTGAGGQVGTALRTVVPGARFADRSLLDVTRPDDALFDGVDVVVHAAAMTNVDACELHPDEAGEVNGDGARRVAAAAARHGARTIFLSTDYVFNGMKSGAYGEDDPPCPINVYGRSKLAGEQAVLEADPRNLVVRTSWVYGEGRNFIRTIRGAAADGRTLRVVDDQVGRPTAAADLAAALKHLIACDAHGIVNVTGAGDPCSWADLAEVVTGGTVGRISTEKFGAPAPRPANSVLSLDRAAALGTPLRDWRSAVAEYLESAA